MALFYLMVQQFCSQEERNVMRQLQIVAFFLLLLTLVACSTPEDTLPTLANTGEQTPNVSTEATDIGVTSEVAATTTPLRRPTLPPPNTVTPMPTETPTETPVFPSETPFVSFATPNPDCNLFDVVFEESSLEFVVGESPRATWLAIPGAELYRVILKQSNGYVVTDTIYVKETTYEFNAEWFREGISYGWEVYPINAKGDQMCFAVGRELPPANRLIPTVSGQ